jgi:hypothetical protein
MLNRQGEWKPVIVHPSYQTEGISVGPIGWIRDAEKPEEVTGTALQVKKARSVAEDWSTSYVKLEQTRLHAIDDVFVCSDIWEEVFFAACLSKYD